MIEYYYYAMIAIVLSLGSILVCDRIEDRYDARAYFILGLALALFWPLWLIFGPIVFFIWLMEVAYKERHRTRSIDPKMKKIPVGYKLPRWLVEWLRSQDTPAAVLIEEALRERFGVAP